MLERQQYEFLQNELRKSRKQVGLLQKDLAKKLQKPQSFVSKVESGERNLDIIEFTNYCAALGLDPINYLKKIINKF